jgi:hypothetical protein
MSSVEFEKLHSGEYYDFADKCYKEGNYLGEAMKSEITTIITDSKIHDKDSKDQAEKIMRLIFATRYEW